MKNDNFEIFLRKIALCEHLVYGGRSARRLYRFDSRGAESSPIHPLPFIQVHGNDLCSLGRTLSIRTAVQQERWLVSEDKSTHHFRRLICRV